MTILILTLNESIHLARCLESVKDLNCRIVIVDSFSKDDTQKIANSYSADFFQNKFRNQAAQINYAFSDCNITTEWVLRLDADEYLSEELQNEILQKLSHLDSNISGVYIKRRVHFMGRWIRWGGYYPIWILRLWRKDKAFVEDKNMDEKVRIKEGESLKFDYDIIEENLNSLSWWTEKHNAYATREVTELIKLKSQKSDYVYNRDSEAESNQWYKNNFYYKLPILLRPFLYFIYRYIFKLGFLDGKAGLMWHILQGFWYRFLIDAKYLESKFK